MSRKKKTGWDFDPQRLDEVSLSELVQIARYMGHTHATHQVPREELENLLLGEDFEVEDPLEIIREKTHEYIKGNAVLLSTLRCSSHCPTCPHERVVHCFAMNSDLILPPEENPIT